MTTAILKRLWSTYLDWVDSAIGRTNTNTATQGARAASALMTLRAFYAYLLFLAFPRFSAASESWTEGSLPKPKLDLEIASLIPTEYWPLVALIAISGVLISSAALVLSPTMTPLRISAALGFVIYTAINFDQRGKINHGNHAAMWIAIGACFLPRGRTIRATPTDLLTGFFGLQLLVGMLYTCAGLCKILGVFYDWEEGTTWFAPEALPLTIAGNWKRSSTTLLGGVLILHQELARVAQVGALLLELFALPAFSVPRLQRYWALALVAMHSLILASMRIHFHESCIILLLFLVASPLTASPIDATTNTSSAAAPSRRRRSILPAAWAPLLIPLYMLTAFSRFSFGTGTFKQELYPVSPMAMFFRVHSDPRHVRQLARIRKRLERRGLFPRRHE